MEKLRRRLIVNCSFADRRGLVAGTVQEQVRPVPGELRAIVNLVFQEEGEKEVELLFTASERDFN